MRPESSIDFSQSVSRTIGININHCLEEIDTGLTRRSPEPMQRKCEVGKLRRSYCCSSPHVSEFAAPSRHQLLSDSRYKFRLVRQ